MIYLIMYVVIAVIWGMISVAMQKKVYPNSSDMRDLVLNFVVNGLIFPISMIWALISYVFKIGWARDL